MEARNIGRFRKCKAIARVFTCLWRTPGQGAGTPLKPTSPEDFCSVAEKTMIMPRPYKEGAPDPVRIKMARGSSIDFMKSTTSIYEGNFVLNGQEYTIAQFHAYGGKSSGATFNLIGYGSKMAYVCKTTSVYLPESYR